REGLDQHLPGPGADQEAGRDPDGFRQGLPGVVGRERQAGSDPVRDVVPERGGRAGGDAPRDPQAAAEVPHRDPRIWGGMMATGQLDTNRRLHVVRKEIARIYTIIRERELGLSAAPSEFVAALQEAEAGTGESGSDSDSESAAVKS